MTNMNEMTTLQSHSCIPSYPCHLSHFGTLTAICARSANILATFFRIPTPVCPLFANFPRNVSLAISPYRYDAWLSSCIWNCGEPGKRSGAWLKYRINRGQEFVIGGYVPRQSIRFDHCRLLPRRKAAVCRQGAERFCPVYSQRSVNADGSAIPTFATEHDWCSQGTIFRASRRLDSIVGSNASEGRSSAAEKRQKSTVSSCAKIGLINSLDCPPVTCRGPLLGTYYGFLNGTPDNVIIVDGRFGQ